MEQKNIEGVIERSIGDFKRGVLYGFKLYPSPYGYPFILPDEAGEVEGKLWDCLNDEDMDKLDVYEGLCDIPPLYFRQKVQISIENEFVEAWVYIGNLQFFYHCLPENDNTKA